MQNRIFWNDSTGFCEKRDEVCDAENVLGSFVPHDAIIGVIAQLTASLVARGVEYVLGGDARDVRKHGQSVFLREGGAGLEKLIDAKMCGIRDG